MIGEACAGLGMKRRHPFDGWWWWQDAQRTGVRVNGLGWEQENFMLYVLKFCILYTDNEDLMNLGHVCVFSSWHAAWHRALSNHRIELITEDAHAVLRHDKPEQRKRVKRVCEVTQSQTEDVWVLPRGSSVHLWDQPCLWSLKIIVWIPTFLIWVEIALFPWKVSMNLWKIL